MKVVVLVVAGHYQNLYTKCKTLRTKDNLVWNKGQLQVSMSPGQKVPRDHSSPWLAIEPQYIPPCFPSTILNHPLHTHFLIFQCSHCLPTLP